MPTRQQMMKKARARAQHSPSTPATSDQAQAPASAQPPAQPQAGQVDQSGIIAPNSAVVRSVPTPPGVGESRPGEANVQDYDPAVAAARRQNVRDRSGQPTTTRDQGGTFRPAADAHRRRGHAQVRDRVQREPAPPGMANVRDPRPGGRDAQPPYPPNHGAAAAAPAQAQAHPHAPQAMPPLAGQLPGGMPPQPQGAPQPGQYPEPAVPPHMRDGQPTQAPPVPENLPPPGPQVPMAIGPGPNNEPFADVTVVVATFRRGHLLRPQLQALADQSMRVRDILLWVNDWQGSSNLHDHEAEVQYNFIRARVNFGPWVRFLIANEVQTKYVCILDDDCIPGPGWIEACVKRLEEMEANEEQAVICAAGRVFQGDDPNAYSVVDAEHRNTDEELVDEGTKGWLMHTGMLDVFQTIPRAQSPVGWGMHMAAACQLAGVFQIVLPQSDDGRTVGALPVPDDEHSLSKMMPGYTDARQHAYQYYRDKQVAGWVPLMLEGNEEAPAGESEDRTFDDDESAVDKADEVASEAAAQE